MGIISNHLPPRIQFKKYIPFAEYNVQPTSVRKILNLLLKQPSPSEAQKGCFANANSASKQGQNSNPGLPRRMVLGVASRSSLGFIHLFLTLAHLDLAPSRHWYAEMNGDTVSFLSIGTVKGGPRLSHTGSQSHAHSRCTIKLIVGGKRESGDWLYPMGEGQYVQMHESSGLPLGNYKHADACHRPILRLP